MKASTILRYFSLLVLLSLPTVAQTPILKSEYAELVVPPGAQITDRYETSWETRMTVEHEGIRVRVNWKADEAIFHFPTSTMRLRVTPDGNSSKTSVNYNADRYVVERSPREIGWLLGGDQQIFYQCRGGKIAKAIGPSDYLKLNRQSQWGRLSLTSSVGSTDALLNAEGVLETFEGPEVLDHLYLVRGLAIQAGPITLRLPLPDDPFLEGLPSDRYLTISKEAKALPQPSAQTGPAKEEDPLQADPATWGSPELKAKFNDPDEDPLSVKKETRVKNDGDPLKARTAPDSEELLRVKDY